MNELLVCMSCGKESKIPLNRSRFKYRVIDAHGYTHRDFCSTFCLIRYYKRVLKQEVKEVSK